MAICAPAETVNNSLSFLPFSGKNLSAKEKIQGRRKIIPYIAEYESKKDREKAASGCRIMCMLRLK